ncbi:MAG TPA: phosphatase PAP2 family protein [Allosphingosinicella sp.]|jgi:hypothetical protein|nr:phosphatase PAP2 family protein [Allosphingosinicella sp.]
MASQPGDQARAYRLHGPQVEPTSGFWLDEPAIRVPALAEVVALTEQPGSRPRLFLDEAFFPSDIDLQRQFVFLKELNDRRSDFPYQVIPAGDASVGDFRGLTPLSRFIHLQDPPFGAIFDTRERTQFAIGKVLKQHLRILSRSPLVNEGRELARMFEDETPGLYHRHALNWLLFLRRDVSPPRHARIWMGLDMAIYTALSAAWFYKWRSQFSRLLRPSEYAVRHDGQQQQTEFSVLYDFAVNEQGHDEEPGPRRDCPLVPPGAGSFHPDSPGTPRHPAWPSGHSTYSAAATYMLEYFFSPDTLDDDDQTLFEKFPAGRITLEFLSNPGWIAAELRRLANNIGEARLWAGVHWVSDHVAGQRIGRAAAQAVIDTFLRDVICPFAPPICDNNNLPPPPTPDQLDEIWRGCRRRPSKTQDAVPQPRPDRQELVERSSGF